MSTFTSEGSGCTSAVPQPPPSQEAHLALIGPMPEPSPHAAAAKTVITPISTTRIRITGLPRAAWTASPLLRADPQRVHSLACGSVRAVGRAHLVTNQRLV